MLHLDKDTFEAEVLGYEGPVFVDFWSESCEPCKVLMPDVEKLAEKYGDTVKFTSLDTTKARRTAVSQRVLGLPTLAIYQNGKKVEEVTKDEATIENIEKMIRKYAIA